MYISFEWHLTPKINFVIAKFFKTNITKKLEQPQSNVWMPRSQSFVICGSQSKLHFG